MRYLQIEGSPMPITPDTFAFIVRHAPLDDACSTFASSHPTLDAVWSLMKHSLTLGAQEQFLDTPTREKGGFLLDSVNQSLAAMAVFGERVLTRKTLHEFLDSMEQHWSDPADWGRINAVYPNGDGARDIPDFTQAYLVWVWWYYLYTGDIGFLQAHYPRLRAVADYVERHRRGSTGLIHELTGGSGPYMHGIIDWPPSMRYGYDMRTEARTVINAHAFADFDIIARIAAELGHLEDERYYRALADSLQAAINQHLLNADGVYSDGLLADGTPSAHLSQQANALPLALGIVPTAHRASVLAHIQALGMRSGMVTVMWLIRALGEAGAGERASRALHQRGAGWLGPDARPGRHLHLGKLGCCQRGRGPQPLPSVGGGRAAGDSSLHTRGDAARATVCSSKNQASPLWTATHPCQRHAPHGARAPQGRMGAGRGELHALAASAPQHARAGSSAARRRGTGNPHVQRLALPRPTGWTLSCC